MSEVVHEPCPLCQQERAEKRYIVRHDAFEIRCPACGEFYIASSGNFTNDRGDLWPQPKRAALSHLLAKKYDFPRWDETSCPYLSHETQRQFLVDLDDGKLVAPNQIARMENAMRYLGNQETELGYVPSPLPRGAWAWVGCNTQEAFMSLLSDMAGEGLATQGREWRDPVNPDYPGKSDVRLTILGWRKWQQLKLGTTSARNGFLAMAFLDDANTRFVKEQVQGKVAGELERDIRLPPSPIKRVDDKDIVRAGLIDNIMREEIESAAFIIADLTHGNAGAYWEAGYAEGLGKPVIYICSQEAWDDEDRKPHFDVSHRTTVMWKPQEADAFVEQLVATIKNSLRHHYPDNQEILPE